MIKVTIAKPQLRRFFSRTSSSNLASRINLWEGVSVELPASRYASRSALVVGGARIRNHCREKYSVGCSQYFAVTLAFVETIVSTAKPGAAVILARRLPAGHGKSCS